MTFMHFIHFIQSTFLSSTNIALFTLVCLFVFAGCSSIVASTKDIKDPLMLSSNPPPIFDPLTSNIAAPHIKILKNNPTLTGGVLVSDGVDAFLSRAYLARMAKKSIILQTYIYKNDMASRILMHEIWLAAQRGVIIKLLIDDNGLDSDFSDIIALDSHPNIEVKIFNPYKNRSRILRYPEMVFDFDRINHRMHNKLFIVDDIALIIGGRNIADNYFDQNIDVNFVDTDVLFVGKVAKDAKDNFYEYWNFHRSIPVSLLPLKSSIKKFKASMEKIKANPQWERYEEEIHTLIDKYNNKTLYWGNATYIGDAPQKVQDTQTPKPIAKALVEILNRTNNNLYISAAYLVPGKEGMKIFETLLASGIEVQILTNSLASTDSLVVYGAWERYRNALVKGGAQVYEYQYLGKGKSKLRDKISKSKASLHSKSIVFDDTITWIGSFNLDPRSIYLNTESVVIFDNPQFAKALKADLIEDMEDAWKVYENHGKTYWEGEHEGKIQTLSYPPDTSIWTRMLKALSKLLPENQI
ncbi:phospholipase D family protein [uncultured Helicobacter sp.]|uniref:phospholipase D family protein n=4 Tax=Helicobacter TaxID=209 RepID=UPI0025F4049B|nr:phospholipase D family protein [uncultured Helicobacter sp.]